MKVLQINIFGNLSTGRIAVDLHRTLVKNGEDGLFAFARNSTADDIPNIRIGSKKDVLLHGIMTRITDKAGFYSAHPTKKLIKEIEEYKPDVIHLHNIHGYYLHIGLLFDYLTTTEIPVVWTLHDCWSYTGHCCYYSAEGCYKWKTGCSKCPQKGTYPASKVLDNSKWNYQKKKDLFSNVNMTLVTVSRWLADEVKNSFLSDYPLEVIYNGIDLDVFKPTPSDFKAKYGLEGKKIILGVASTWSERKGLNDFIKLSRIINNDWKIVVVGVNDSEIEQLTDNMIGIKRTDSIKELAEIYTAADVFFNASVEETFGLPTIEAMACGTPSVVYNATALPELIEDGCGAVVEPHNLNAVLEQVYNIDKITTEEQCIANALRFDREKLFLKYVELYRKISQK